MSVGDAILKKGTSLSVVAELSDVTDYARLIVLPKLSMMPSPTSNLYLFFSCDWLIGIIESILMLVVGFFSELFLLSAVLLLM